MKYYFKIQRCFVNFCHFRMEFVFFFFLLLASILTRFKKKGFSSLYSVWLTNTKHKLFPFSFFMNKPHLFFRFAFFCFSLFCISPQWLHCLVLKFKCKYLDLVLLKFHGIDGDYHWKALTCYRNDVHNGLIQMNTSSPPHFFVCGCLCLILEN